MILFPERRKGIYIRVCVYTFFWLLCAACGISVPQPGIKLKLLAVEAQSPNHWTAREFLVLIYVFFNTNGFFLSIYTHRHVHACMCVHMSVHCFESYFIWMYFYISTYIFTSVFKIVVWCDCIILHLTLQFHLKSVFLKEFFDEYICMLILLSFCGCSHKKKCLTVELLNQEQVQFKFCLPKSLHKSTAQPACRNLPVSLS